MLNSAVYASRGFNVIATANDRDKGVNEMSSALKRRFNVVVLPPPDDLDQEIAIVTKRVQESAAALDLPAPKNVAEEVAPLKPRAIPERPVALRLSGLEPFELVA